MRRAAVALMLALAPFVALAGELQGRVVGVADGDTLTILGADRQQSRVRLAEIDAPEKAQPFGQRSKQALSDLCFGRDAVIADKGRDRYGRTVGRVRCGGIDTSAEQVRRGMAWVYDRYVTDQSLYALQAEARAARRGLWADSAPVPPWEWRHRK
jgi:endonuclease YncB( thermonuclease family)